MKRVSTRPRANQFGHDAAGRQTSQTGYTTRTDTYDNAGQLTAATIGTDSWTFAYDHNGNLVTENAPGTTADWTSTFNDANQLTSRTAGAVTETFDYDADRRLIEHDTPQGTRTFEYDLWGRLVADTTPAGTDTRTYLPTGQIDGIDMAGGHEWQLEWDDQPITQLTVLEDDDANTWNRYTNTPTTRLAARANNGSNALFSYNPDGTPIVTWPTLAMVRSIKYDPYGQALSPETNRPTFGYRGELHTDTLIHLRNRDHNPALRRFNTPDPLDGISGTPVETNPNHYTNNDPLNKTDPLGLRPGEETFDEKGEPDWTYEKSYHLWDMDPDDKVLDATGHTAFGIVSLWMGEVMNEPNRIFPFLITGGAITPGASLCTRPLVFRCDPVEVLYVNTYSWGFESQEGHIEGPGGEIHFGIDTEFGIDEGCYLIFQCPSNRSRWSLTVNAFGWGDNGWARAWGAEFLWQEMARKMKQSFTQFYQLKLDEHD